MNKCQMIVRRIAPTWLLLCFLLIGLVASTGIVGVKLDALVLNSTSTIGPVSWPLLGIWAFYSAISYLGLESDGGRSSSTRDCSRTG